MEKFLDNPPAVVVLLAVLLLLSIYVILILAKVVVMKIHEDYLLQTGQMTKLHLFRQKKTLRHVLSLGLL